MSLEELAIFRVSWARRLVGAAVVADGDGRVAGPMPRVLDEFDALASLASDLPAVRGKSVPELRRAAARMDFCLGAVLQFDGAVRQVQHHRRTGALPGLSSQSRAPERMAELARQGLAAR